MLLHISEQHRRKAPDQKRILVAPNRSLSSTRNRIVSFQSLVLIRDMKQTKVWRMHSFVFFFFLYSVLSLHMYEMSLCVVLLDWKQALWFCVLYTQCPTDEPQRDLSIQGKLIFLTGLFIKHRHSLERHPAVVKGARLIENHRQLPGQSTKWDMEDNMTAPGTTRTTLQEWILMHKYLFFAKPNPSVLLICIQSLICKIWYVKPALGLYYSITNTLIIIKGTD